MVRKVEDPLGEGSFVDSDEVEHRRKVGTGGLGGI